jgi:hypothetical protein
MLTDDVACNDWRKDYGESVLVWTRQGQVSGEDKLVKPTFLTLIGFQLIKVSLKIRICCFTIYRAVCFFILKVF